MAGVGRSKWGVLGVSRACGQEELQGLSRDGSHDSLSSSILPSLGARSSRRIKLRRFIVSPYDRYYRHRHFLPFSLLGFSLPRGFSCFFSGFRWKARSLLCFLSNAREEGDIKGCQRFGSPLSLAPNVAGDPRPPLSSTVRIESPRYPVVPLSFLFPFRPQNGVDTTRHRRVDPDSSPRFPDLGLGRAPPEARSSPVRSTEITSRH
ncbi:hypothetical protein NL676_035620 [Syzygium grande]|nr:hypothetical protein NL676_035620 [Syzygium grande]